jgi:hypothetical protein
MALTLWISCDDEALFRTVSNVELGTYPDDILTGKLENEGSIANMRHAFVLGGKGIWIPKDTDQEYPFIHIRNSSAYREGLILTPYSEIDVKYHSEKRRKQTIEERTGIHRVELYGDEQEDFIERVFRTYQTHPLINKFVERDHHLLVYSSRN